MFFTYEASLEMNIFFRLVNGPATAAFLGEELNQPAKTVLTCLSQLQQDNFAKQLIDGSWCVMDGYLLRKNTA
jgi:hypothetical protein